MDTRSYDVLHYFLFHCLKNLLIHLHWYKFEIHTGNKSTAVKNIFILASICEPTCLLKVYIISCLYTKGFNLKNFTTALLLLPQRKQEQMICTIFHLGTMSSGNVFSCKKTVALPSDENICDYRGSNSQSFKKWL